MKTSTSLTNVSFDFLKGSNEFLNLVLNNIQTCVLLLDSNLNLKAFNDPLKSIFSHKKDEDLLYRRCGEAIGCAHQVEEQKNCGSTTKCNNCELRISALKSYIDNRIIYMDYITRPFFNFKNQKVEKLLRFSTRLFYHEQEKYIIMIIEDITGMSPTRS